MIQSKLPDVGTTIFTVMSVLAAEHKAVNLGQGFPDFQMSDALTSLVDKAMKNGFNQYTHMNGYPLLRERLCEKAHKLYNASIDPETQVTVTPGGTYAIYTSLTTVLRPGDEVIVFEPAYDSYIPNIEINGATPVLIPLQFPDYSIPWDEVRAKVNGKTKMIMINTPHNPTGMVLREQDIEQLRSIVANTGILILSDEVYEHLIFDNIPHQSMLRYPDLMERSFVCFSFGKTYHCTGWKLGYCISSPALMKEFRKVHQFNCFSCDTPKQVAVAEYIRNEEAYLSLPSFLQQKRDLFRELMSATPFECIPSHGSYFECYSYRNFSDEPDKDLAIRLTKEYGIATIPMSAFYKHGQDNKVLRFCFAKKEETLRKAVEKLTTLR
ncbi:aminotransferase class I/II-fold pyridoxal phosphate-dependent enzyme [Sediminibacterium roseum]|uniref:Aminotransferase class I/II-fold pyridoxal phosphate-dependent enzyme n=1 Tax=Sediminibacterium roseum TaxID=1978412 RepID=A0ABW9ZXI9_9BACT|nr:methionine aminotransferase [Sediminibacterium roseum]NCI51887.1 aminotransferase class I/II-fold pyridoxal phosphate-dependent enzyme [Sediminibacterium roseum]